MHTAAAITSPVVSARSADGHTDSGRALWLEVLVSDDEFARAPVTYEAAR
jgi:hypothetical protein